MSRAPDTDRLGAPRLVLAFTALVPLAMHTGLVYGYVVPKELLVLAATQVLCLVALARYVRGAQGSRLPTTPIVWAGLALLVSLWVSALHGVDPERSLRGSLPRGLGVVTLTHYAVLFVLARRWLTDESAWRFQLRVMLSAAVAVVAVAAAQKVEPGFLAPGNDPRVSGTLGHPGYLGSLGLSLVFLALYLRTLETGAWARASASAAALAGVAGVVLSESRGAQLGLAFGALTALLICWRVLPAGRARTGARAAFLLLVGGACASLPLLGLEGRILELERALWLDRSGIFARWCVESGTPPEDIAAQLDELLSAGEGERAEALGALEVRRAREAPALPAFEDDVLEGLDPQLLTANAAAHAPGMDAAMVGRLQAYRAVYDAVYAVPGLRRFLRSSPMRRAAELRALNWGVALEAAGERPLLGWGPSNYERAFDPHYRPVFLEHGPGETWFDDAHNVFLHTLVVQGAWGLLAYLALVGAAFLLLIRALRRGQLGAVAAAALIALFAGHLVMLQAGFEDPSSYVVLVFSLALVDFLSRPRGVRLPCSPAPLPRRLAALVPAGAVVLLGWTLVREPLRSNPLLREGLGQLAQDRPAQALASLDRYLELDPPHGSEARILFAGDAIELGQRALAGGGRARPAAADTRALLLGVDEHLALLPSSSAEYVRAVLFRARGAVLLELLGGEGDRLGALEEDLAAALLCSPGRQELLYLLSQARWRRGRPTAEILAPLEQAVAGAPRVGSSWYHLADALARMGREPEALEALASAERAGARYRPLERAAAESLREALERRALENHTPQQRAGGRHG